jgi:predicted RNase H-like HicB family nuclease
MNFKGTVVIHPENGWYVATCLENYVASQGRTIDEALANLKEAIELYYEDDNEIPAYEPSYVTSLEVEV